MVNGSVVAVWVHNPWEKPPYRHTYEIGMISGPTTIKARAHSTTYGWSASDVVYLDKTGFITKPSPPIERDIMVLIGATLIIAALTFLVKKRLEGSRR